MAFRNPSASSSSVLNIHDVSTSGIITQNFTVPQDSESLCAKIWLDSTWNATGTATVFIQTTEDGGTTWRDVSVTQVGASTVAATVGNQNAHFIPLNLTGGSDHGISNYVGSVAASTLTAGITNASMVGTVSGLPILGTLNRVQIAYTATITTGGVNVQVFSPNAIIR